MTRLLENLFIHVHNGIPYHLYDLGVHFWFAPFRVILKSSLRHWGGGLKSTFKDGYHDLCSIELSPHGNHNYGQFYM